MTIDCVVATRTIRYGSSHKRVVTVSANRGGGWYWSIVDHYVDGGDIERGIGWAKTEQEAWDASEAQLVELGAPHGRHPDR